MGNICCYNEDNFQPLELGKAIPQLRSLSHTQYQIIACVKDCPLAVKLRQAKEDNIVYVAIPEGFYMESYYPHKRSFEIIIRHPHWGTQFRIVPFVPGVYEL